VNSLPTALAALLLTLLALPAQAAMTVGSGVSKTEARAVAGFHAIALGVDARLEIRQGATESLAITGDDNIVPLVETVVEGGVLKIRWPEHGNVSTRYRDLAIVVDAKTLDAIALGGSGRIHAPQLAATTFSAKVGGSGDIVIDALEADSVAATLGGSGRIVLAGRADSLEATLSGSGSLAAGKLATRDVRTSLQGSAQATVWAKDALRATISGSGDIAYYGRPKVTQTIAGSGAIRHAGDAP
jgi:hypothetical protein